MVMWVVAALAAPMETTTMYEPGKGYQIRSEDGRFGLNIKSRIQLLQTVTALPDGTVAQGLSIPRARLDFSGHGFGDWNHWRVQLAFSPKDVGHEVPEGPTRGIIADLTWTLKPKNVPMSLMVGQHKVPITRQRIASTAILQFVDRHILDSEFSFDRDTGILFQSWGWKGPDDKGPRVRTYAGVYQGNGRTFTTFQDTGIIGMVRGEVLPSGWFPYWAEGDLQRSERFLWGVGVGAAGANRATHEKGSTGEVPTDGGTTDFAVLTGDFAMRFRGVSLDGVMSMRSGTRNAPAGVPASAIDLPRNALGWSLQGGVMLPRIPVGVGLRHSAIDPLAADSSMPVMREDGGSISWFIAGHPYDLTTDVFRVAVDDEVTWRGRMQLELAL